MDRERVRQGEIGVKKVVSNIVQCTQYTRMHSKHSSYQHSNDTHGISKSNSHIVAVVYVVVVAIGRRRKGRKGWPRARGTVHTMHISIPLNISISDTC